MWSLRKSLSKVSSLRSVPAESPRQSATRRPSTQIAIELLEDRTVPSAGDLDPTFGVGGKVTTDFFTGGDFINGSGSLAIQSDGKIVAGGWTQPGRLDFAIARYNPDGSLDNSFGDNGRVNVDIGGGANGLTLQTDGKIVVVGDSSTGSLHNFAVARLNTDGSPDTSFGTNGQVKIGFGASQGGCWDVAMQGDKIVVGGYTGELGVSADFAVARLNANGSLDLTFDADGKATVDFGSSDEFAYRVAVRADKIIVAGHSANPDRHWAVARLNTDGSLDEDFGINGRTLIDSMPESIYGISFAAEGKIIAVGRSFDDDTGWDFAVARLNADGSLDSDFGAGGTVSVDFGSVDDSAVGVAIQSGGKVIAVGWTYVEETADYDFAVVRLNVDGSLDTTFGDGGKVATDFANDSASAVVVQPGGKIVVAGYAITETTGYDFALARLLGSSNPANVAPTVTLSGPSSANEGEATHYSFTTSDPEADTIGLLSITAGPDATISNQTFDGTTGAGSFDVIFRDGPNVASVSVQVEDSEGADSNVPSIAVVVANVNPNAMANFYKINQPSVVTGNVLTDGAPDTDPAGANDPLTVTGYTQPTTGAVTIAADGSFTYIPASTFSWTDRFTYTIADGDGGFSTATVIISAEGMLDPAFGVGGKVTTDVGDSFSSFDLGNAVAVQSDGKIVVAGLSVGTTNGFGVARYNQDGSLDTSFSSDGRATFNFGNGNATGVAVQPDGKIVVVGSHLGATGLDFAVARLNSDGALDNTFNGNGTRNIDFFGDYEFAKGVALQSDGKIVVVGLSNASFDFAIARLNSDGSLDGDFDGDGRVTIDFFGYSGTSDEAYAVAVQPDGSVLAAGFAMDIQEIPLFAVARLTPSGQLDSSFGSGGKQTIDFGGIDARATGMALQSDGSVVMAGFSYNGFSSDFALARLNAAGQLDLSFNGSGKQTIDFGGYTASASGVALQGDGKLVVAGTTNWNEGMSAANDMAVARVNRDGSLDNSFGSGGKQTIDFGGYEFAAGVALQLDGKIVIAGHADQPGTSYDFAVARLQGNGDTDSDGIANAVDTSPATFSGDFSDGSTTGTIVSRGDQMLMIADAPIAAEGVIITAALEGGAEAAIISIDGGASTLSLEPGDQIVVTHGSVIIRVVAGSVETTFVAETGAMATVDLDAGNGLTFKPDEFNFFAPPTNTVVVQITITTDGGEEATAGLPAGNVVAFEPKTGSFVAPETNTEPIEITDSDGTVVVIDPGESVIVVGVAPARLQGLVWEDYNDDGLVDFGERAIAGVLIRLSGFDDRGAAVNLSMTTDAQGIFEFTDLRPSGPGGYSIAEDQPVGFVDGIEALGTVNGVPSGEALDNLFRNIDLTPGAEGVNYNFGERPTAGSGVAAGQTATIGFWQNKNGQNLIKSLNGGAGATQLGNWLAATFPNMYGASAGSGNLTGQTNAQVGAFYTSLFKRTSAVNGPPKTDAQVFATALAVYVTNQTLAGSAATSYGFHVTTHGVGIATFNVGNANRAAFGLSPTDSTVMTVLDILLATDTRARNGLLYDLDGSGTISVLEKTLREMANAVYSAINEQGDI